MNHAAAAAKSLRSCPTLCDPKDSSPPGSPVPGILQARTLERVAISFSKACKWKVKVKSLSRVWLFMTPWTAAYQSMGFSRQEYWRGVPLPSPYWSMIGTQYTTHTYSVQFDELWHMYVTMKPSPQSRLWMLLLPSKIPLFLFLISPWLVPTPATTLHWSATANLLSVVID